MRQNTVDNELSALVLVASSQEDTFSLHLTSGRHFPLGTNLPEFTEALTKRSIIQRGALLRGEWTNEILLI
jgi:hypothetical protein